MISLIISSVWFLSSVHIHSGDCRDVYAVPLAQPVRKALLLRAVSNGLRRGDSGTEDDFLIFLRRNVNQSSRHVIKKADPDWSLQSKILQCFYCSAIIAVILQCYCSAKILQC